MIQAIPVCRDAVGKRGMHRMQRKLFTGQPDITRSTMPLNTVAGTCTCLQPVQLVQASGAVCKHEEAADRHHSVKAAES